MMECRGEANGWRSPDIQAISLCIRTFLMKVYFARSEARHARGDIGVGVDIGTSTTQLIFSRLTIENRRAVTLAPRIQIVKRGRPPQRDILYAAAVGDGDRRGGGQGNRAEGIRRSGHPSG